MPVSSTLTKTKTKTERDSSLQNKKAAVVIAFRNFQDEEYFVSKEALEEEGIKVVTVSDDKGVAIGANGGETKVDFTIDSLRKEEMNALVFIGGSGCLDHLDNEKTYNLAKSFNDKILGAICISPVILAKAGILENRKATVWSSEMDKEPIEILKNNNVEYIDKNVVEDNNVITANGPKAAREFGARIARALTK